MWWGELLQILEAPCSITYLSTSPAVSDMTMHAQLTKCNRRDMHMLGNSSYVTLRDTSHYRSYLVSIALSVHQSSCDRMAWSAMYLFLAFSKLLSPSLFLNSSISLCVTLHRPRDLSWLTHFYSFCWFRSCRCRPGHSLILVIMNKIIIDHTSLTCGLNIKSVSNKNMRYIRS